MTAQKAIDKLPTPELLPCPFCGCKDIDPEGVAYYPQGDKDKGLHHDPACNQCSATTAYPWNTRAATKPAVPQQMIDIVQQLSANVQVLMNVIKDPAGGTEPAKWMVLQVAQDTVDRAKEIIGAQPPSLPCVCCGKPAQTATPDDAEMCHECFGQFNATEYGNLRKRFEELIQRDYPDADLEDALDPCRPLPDSPIARLQAENEVMTEALLYYASPETYEDAFDRILRDGGDKARAALGKHDQTQETRAP